ncbi:hypothetical protein DHOM_07595 [Dermabacter hominis 1368]|uniref:Uncharacterized protein n=1 Tax=Dermabacter hominis 1368 TaxID=1450519 RepID=A0ABR4SJF8_9MICO|nr:hypothetical protein DHOM_07595 [Dermabacter hominis 1368]
MRNYHDGAGLVSITELATGRIEPARDIRPVLDSSLLETTRDTGSPQRKLERPPLFDLLPGQPLPVAKTAFAQASVG